MSPTGGSDDERRFWRSLRGGADVAGAPEADRAAATPRGAADAGTERPEAERADGTSPAEDPAERRRAALRSMLDAAEARVSRASRVRRPVLASGAVVRVTRGELAGRTGVIVDADYIESRVLLSVDPDEAPRWVPFRRVGAVDADD